MREAARAFVGHARLQVVRRRRGPRRRRRDARASTLVLVDRLDIVEDGDLVLVGVEGSHFLWKMVRRMVGVLVEIGRGGLEPDAAARFLADASTAPARLTAPPSGLFLGSRVLQRTTRATMPCARRRRCDSRSSR